MKNLFRSAVGAEDSAKFVWQKENFEKKDKPKVDLSELPQIPEKSLERIEAEHKAALKQAKAILGTESTEKDRKSKADENLEKEYEKAKAEQEAAKWLDKELAKLAKTDGKGVTPKVLIEDEDALKTYLRRNTIIRHEDGSMRARVNGEWFLREKGEKHFRSFTIEGKKISRFDGVLRHNDGSTKVRVNGKWYLIERGENSARSFTIEEGKEVSGFDNALVRSRDGSTTVLVNGKLHIISAQTKGGVERKIQ